VFFILNLSFLVNKCGPVAHTMNSVVHAIVIDKCTSYIHVLVYDRGFEDSVCDSILLTSIDS